MLAAFAALTVVAQDSAEKAPIARLDGIARVDWQYHRVGSETDDAQSGFYGRYFMLKLDGEIAKGLTYSWRQRLNKSITNASFFDATDWVYLNYDYKKWSFAGGKQIVGIGGYEYDRAPYNLYGCSVFWNNVPCYQLGASVSYKVAQADKLMLQVNQSLFASPGNRNMYAYNLMWTGSHGWYESIWSVNMIEYTKNHYINYIALGNKFKVGKWSLELDLMNRAASHQVFLGKDFSVMGELAFTPNAKWRIHGKITHDVNKSGTGADMLVLDGTKLTMAGAGVEYFPLSTQRNQLRLHACAYYSWGRNANPDDLMQQHTTLGAVGVTWYMNILNVNRHHRH